MTMSDPVVRAHYQEQLEAQLKSERAVFDAIARAAEPWPMFDILPCPSLRRRVRLTLAEGLWRVLHAAHALSGRECP